MTPAVRPLAMGDLIRNNDPRMHGRLRVVTTFNAYGDRVSAGLPPDGTINKTWVGVRFIHLDAKPRRSGWSRVTT